MGRTQPGCGPVGNAERTLGEGKGHETEPDIGQGRIRLRRGTQGKGEGR